MTATKQFAPYGNGTPLHADLQELDAADANWKAKNAIVERIAEEIYDGKRR
ncbi:hypothetical protein [Burkholderia multivorans]|uniref:hypothetical protein n=1 Tax=Burkholderia multivorans TaxID=87883 RepID=UPI001C242A29|nr:hypothetical protein [Burkholderia multivorans]MBU9165143.1 hypothetical protein [Burkholderia multivorans]MBU9546828.1 hypothetical protein [Burkholderia multivorans]MCA8178324.1 hypothetical protein [Burkholderia multivorans]